jgi:hypothetical protein
VPARFLEVEGKALFVAVYAEEIRAFSFEERGPPSPGIIAAVWGFDFDDPGPEVRGGPCISALLTPGSGR